MREIGVLLMAFAPLDVAISGGREFAWGTLLGFFSTGFGLFVLALLAEWRFNDDD